MVLIVHLFTISRSSSLHMFQCSPFLEVSRPLLLLLLPYHGPVLSSTYPCFAGPCLCFFGRRGLGLRVSALAMLLLLLRLGRTGSSK